MNWQYLDSSIFIWYIVYLSNFIYLFLDLFQPFRPYPETNGYLVIWDT